MHSNHKFPAYPAVSKKFAALNGARSEALEDWLSTVEASKTATYKNADALIAGERRLGIVQSGHACAYTLYKTGARHVSRLYHPGDIIGLPDVFGGPFPYSVRALSKLDVAFIEPWQFTPSLQKQPSAMFALMSLASADRRADAARAKAIARLEPKARVAHLLLESLDRVRLTSSYHNGQIASSETFSIPGTQKVLADLMGLSAVHVSRMLTGLQKEGLIGKPARHMFEIVDRAALVEMAEYVNPYKDPTPSKASGQALPFQPELTQKTGRSTQKRFGS